ncbi:MAG: hypothetical protein ACI89X_000810 [Planctomycetota bacterium]|jgi:hypothetical protein
MAKFDLRCVFVLLLLFVTSCSSAGYSPYPLDLEHKLPADAFARCRAVLLSHYDTLAYSDAESFRLETEWLPIADPPGERRATVYRESARPASLAIVVELRRLTVPLIGVPHWTAARGDDYSERQLADWLRESLRDLEVTGVAMGTEQIGGEESGGK